MNTLRTPADFLAAHQNIHLSVRPSHYWATSPHFATEAELLEWMASGPKVKFTIKRLHFEAGVLVWYAESRGNLQANGANGGKNETAIKRLRAIMAAGPDYVLGLVPSQESLEFALEAIA